MNNRNSRMSRRKRHERSTRDSNHYFVNIVLITTSILVISALGFYLKNMNSSKTQKVEINNKINEEVSYTDDNKARQESIKAIPVKKDVLISFAGDCTLGTDTKFSYDNSLPAAFINNGKNYSYFMKNVYSVFSNDDYTLVNLETTLTDSNVKSTKEGAVYYNFKGPKDYVNILAKSSIEGATIANNHIYDYGKQGMQDTVNALKESNVDICGEGYKILKEIKGVKFGFLGYTGWEYSNELKSKIVNDINELREQGAEVVIPYFHWGIERNYQPYDVQQKLARFSIDNGADAVIGSHPHVIQSIENYKGKFIAYSLGNFCFGGNSNPPDKRTYILQLKANLEDDKLINFEYKVIPTMISSRNDKNDYIPTVASGENRADILKMLNDLSPSLNGNIKDEFFCIT